MAYRNNNTFNGIQSRLCVKVNRHLRFCVTLKVAICVSGDVVFDSNNNFVSKVEAEGQLALGLVCCIAEHNALVASTDFCVRGNCLIDFIRLLTDKVDNRIHGVTELGGNSADDFNIIDLCVCGDFTAENHGVILYHRFNATMAVSVL